MALIVTPRSYRRMVQVLREFEGPKCLWRIPAALLIAAAVIALPIAGAVAGVYIGADRSVGSVIAGATVTLVAGTVANELRRRKPWRAIIARPLSVHEASAPATEVQLLVRTSEDVDRLEPALRRAGVNPVAALRIGAPPHDAPELIYRVRVEEPLSLGRAVDDHTRTQRIAAIMLNAGVRGRVGGLDVGRADRGALHRLSA
jgi:hypothetical protein